MFAIERIRIIKNYIINNQQAEVSTLSSMLNVSEVTIRRDLEKLESEGFLTRTHGGAVLNKIEENIISTTEEYNLTDYQEIAEIAVQLIKDGDIIMLTSGIINLYIAKKLGTKNNITILTNDITIAMELSTNKSVKVVLLGGDMDFRYNAVFGTLTNNNLKQFFVTKLFIEIDGISSDLDLTVSSIDMASLIQEAAINASQKILLLTADAFEKNSFYRVGKANQIADRLITNSRIKDTYKNILFNSNIQLFTSIDAFEGKV
ncbi:DeoR family transcriptional regulator [Anaerocolumna sedimenticola]|uniref:DeoR family transcriptional regulator n=1 Tax=Anaerocolumna sedimenticola TaxID=2696063 RepID=A0A6P1TJ30_9FIRM|nr:DeoR/GlpR family DNA-binding transcription regulator [Anaerocolumna sedimenticola]QHQ60119.1 DeoR family transcriptional regulator [Anaerocolumna sedimenticola]